MRILEPPSGYRACAVCSRHCLKSRYCYRYQPMVSSINIINISRQYQQHSPIRALL